MNSPKRDRSTYLGGRCVATLAGVNPYGSKLDLYAKIVHGHTVAMNGAMERGLLVEPGILDWVERRRQVPLVRDLFVVDSRHSFMAGSVDAVEMGADGKVRYCHEVKSTRARGASAWGAPGTDEVEPSAYIQVQWYMGLTGAQGAYVWLYNLDADDGPQEYFVRADPDMYRRLQHLAEDFWVDHVLTQVPPAPDGKTDPEATQAVWPAPKPGKEVPADDDLKALASAYDAARAQAKVAEGEKYRLAGELKARIADGERAKWDGGSVSWLATTLPAKTDWESVALEIAQHCKMPGEQYDAAVRKHTSQTRTTRTLRCVLKEKP